MKNNSKFYTYRITWLEDGGEYLGLCAEFPSLSYLHKNPSEALDGIASLVCDVVQDMRKNNEKIPEALSKKEYSGKFVVRIPPEKNTENCQLKPWKKVLV